MNDNTDKKLLEIQQNLAAVIRERFSGWKCPFPSKESLFAELRNEELKPLGQPLSRPTWDPLDGAGVAPRDFVAIPLMSDQLFTYLLPTLMLHLMEFDDVGNEWVKEFVDRIGAPAPKGQPIKVTLDFTMLNTGQSEVLKQCLNYLATYFEGLPRVQRRIGCIIDSIEDVYKT